jgi:hypothetical protein
MTSKKSEEKGKKFDQKKLRVDLLSVPALLSTAYILTLGSKKYGSRNWEKGMEWTRVWGALLRHILAWFLRVPFDKESKKSHLDHASCCVQFLQHYEKMNVGTDDRPVYDIDPKIVEELFNVDDLFEDKNNG